MALPDRASNILPVLLSEFDGTTGDIVFVGYSMGGLVTQSVLRLAETKAPHDEKAAAFLRRVRAFVLLGTPTAGSAHATRIGWISRFFRPRETIDDLKHENPYLRDLNTWFRGFVTKNNIKGLVIREHKPVPYLGVIVSPSSADPGLPISTPIIPVDEDHISLSHPSSRDSDVYKHIAAFLRDPLHPPHPDSLIVDTIGGLKATIQDAQERIGSDVSEALAGQRKLEEAFERLAPENPLVTENAQSRLLRLRQIRFTAGFDAKAECFALMQAVVSELASASKDVRRSIFAWCSRILAILDYQLATTALEKALQFGESDETEIARAFLAAHAPRPDRALALSILANIRTPLSYTAAFMIASHEEIATEAFRWLELSGLSIDQLDPDGKFCAVGLLLNDAQWDSALQTVEALTETDYAAAPCLHFIAGNVFLAQALNPEIRSEVLNPFTDRLADLPLGEDATSMSFRAKALFRFERAAAEFEKLGAKIASVAADHALWLALRGSETREKALRDLEDSMSDRRTRLRRLPMALAFGLKLDMQAVEREIDAETILSGGNSHQAAIARFVVALERKAPEVPDYIERHRNQLLTYYSMDYIDAIQTEALTKSGRIDEARTKLQSIIGRGGEPSIVSGLTQIIEAAAASDPIASHEADYLSHPTLSKLIALVARIRSTKDAKKLLEYSRKLFDAVKDVSSAELYTYALYELGDDKTIIDISSQYPEIADASKAITTNVAWAHFRLGDLSAAKAILDRPQNRQNAHNDDANNRYLRMNIAIASGDWSSLSSFVESEWDNRGDREPIELLRAGKLAQQVGSLPRSQELIRAAAEKADGDAEILINCYSAATEGGWENEAASCGWLAKAIEASGEDGPVKRVDIQDILDSQPGWNQRIDRIWGLLLRGEVPMFLAAQPSNRTLLDLYLRPALRNLEEVDPRKRGIIFSFAGNRNVRQVAGRKLAADVTALLTWTIIGQLQSILTWCESLVISHTTLNWLFQERDRLAFHQPSQVKRAEEVKRLVDTDELHEFEGDATLAELEHEAGPEIAKYLTAAKTKDSSDAAQRVVIRPYPLPKSGTLLKENANIAGYEQYIAGCRDVIDALKASSHLTIAEENSALSYLKNHEEAWPHSPKVEPGATLYLDDLAVNYFQQVGLLSRLSKAGFKVFITTSEIERANEFTNLNTAADAASRHVDELQNALRDGIASGKITLNHLKRAEDDPEDTHPSRLLLISEMSADVVVIDDRAFNKHATMGTMPIATSLDIIATMEASGALSREAALECVTKMRRAGLVMVPCRPGEVSDLLNAATVVSGTVQETAELRAVRESFTRVRMTDCLQLPGEAFWIDEFSRQLLNAIRVQWSDTIPDPEARARSRWAVQLLDPRGWSHIEPLGANAADRYRAQIAMLLMNTTASPSIRARYWEWLESEILEEFKYEQHEEYARLVAMINTHIENAVNSPLTGDADA